MGAGGTPGRADLAEHLASHKLVADLHANFGEMAEHADQPLAVVDENGLAVEEVVTGEYDLAGRRCLDRDRKSVVSGKSVSVRVDLGGRRIIKNKITI